MDVNGPNAEQVRYWNDAVGTRWAAEQAILDAEAFTERLQTGPAPFDL